MAKNAGKNEKRKSLFYSLEEEVLSFWNKSDIFDKSVKKEAPNGDYVFYDGPPFATGLPHYGHIVASIIKDAVPRYWTMRGFRVERKWGWDCHGLPIENIVEKELGSKCKRDIEEIGVDKFNELCRSKVTGYVDDWKRVIAKLGRWADMENDYKTMDLPFMESVWHVFKTIYNKGLVYKGYRSMHVCPRCETTLSQSEVTEGYKDIKDLSAIAKFELVDEPNTFVLAWTTTPWTLIGNVALAVGSDLIYVKIKVLDGEKKGETYIVALERSLEVLLQLGLHSGDLQKNPLEKEGDKLKFDKFEAEKIKGSDLVGKSYKPLFDYYSKVYNISQDEKGDVIADDKKNKERGENFIEKGKNGWKIYPADFVNTEEGTGIVHIAPAFGDNDMNLGKEHNLPFVQHLTMDGYFKPEVKDFAGMNVKPKENHMATDIEIIKYLAHKDLLFSKKKYEHSYPHCWRCDTPLLNYATSSWFVDVTKIKGKMLDNAKPINWAPEHVKRGRWGKWLEGARDWSISRQRFWASVMPIWECKCGERKVVGSIEELEKEVDLGSFYIMRHGEAEANAKKIYNTDINTINPLTEKGKADALASAKGLKDKGIDLIICSDFQRTQETAAIVGKEIGVEVISDERIREISTGELDGKAYDLNIINSRRSGEDLSYPGGESWTDVKRRVDDFYRDISFKYKDKKILVISHGDALLTMQATLMDGDFLKNIKDINERKAYIQKAEVRKLKHRIVDIHKHVVDEIQLPCPKCEAKMKRIPDVLDTWFDSGSMPFAQMHYPFENKEKFEENFPAEFIAEGTDQTRCWFYYMHILANGAKDTNAFKNVIVNGIVLAEDGKKMSKKLQNYPDPMAIFERYGADALRYYLLTSPVMLADNLNFSEKGVSDSLRRINMTLWNVLKFFMMFESESGSKNFDPEKRDSANVLDKWILARLNQLIKEVNRGMEAYNLPEASRPIAVFIDDLSTWYIRRSRDRFKGENENDKSAALATTRFVLLELSKITAPFTPFIAEQVWQKISGNDFRDMDRSVHLEEWPQLADADLEGEKIVREMEAVRKIVELGLAKRDEAGIKVRQPLNELRIANCELRIDYLELIKDEVNVKNILFKKNEGDLFVELDTEINEELKLEGMKRELVRFINSLRKEAGLSIGDRVDIFFDTESEVAKKTISKFKDEIKNDTLSDEIKEGVDDFLEYQKEIKANGEALALGLIKK